MVVLRQLFAANAAEEGAAPQAAEELAAAGVLAALSAARAAYQVPAPQGPRLAQLVFLAAQRPVILGAASGAERRAAVGAEDVLSQGRHEDDGAPRGGALHGARTQSASQGERLRPEVLQALIQLASVARVVKEGPLDDGLV